jgi:hypothetical protein
LAAKGKKGRSRAKKKKKRKAGAAPNASEAANVDAAPTGEDAAGGDAAGGDAVEGDAVDGESGGDAAETESAGTTTDVDVFDLDTDLDAAPAAAPMTEEPVVFDLDAEIDGSETPAAEALVAELESAAPPEPAEAADAASAPGSPLADGGDSEAVDALSPAGEDGDAEAVEEDAEVEVEDLDADLGPTSTPEARARILAAALAHAEMQEARYRVPTLSRRTGHIKATLAFAFLATAGFVALVPPPLVVPTPLPTLSVADRDRGSRLSLLLQAQQIEAFRAVELRLPTSLDEAGASVPGIRYVRSSNRLYQLVAYTEDGRAIVYDSSAPGPEFGALSPSWAGERGS